MATWFHGLNKGDRIIELAIETLLGLFDELPHTKGVGTVKSPPIDNEASLQKRQSMFEFQVAHQRVLEAMKSLQDFESQTIHSTADGVLASTDQNAIRAIDTWIDALRDIDATNVRSRDQLKNCKVNNTGIAILDGLINAHIRRGPCSPLFQMPSDEDRASAKKRLSDSSSSYWSNAETVAATLKDIYDFEPEYYLNRKSSQKTQPVSVEATKASGPMQVSYSQSAKVVVDEVQYAIHDTNTAEASTNPMIAVVPLTCFKWLASMTAEIDVSRFKLNYEMFEQCVNRPDAFANPATRLKDNAIVRQKHGRLYMAQDNVYQIRALLDLICENHLCVGSDTFPRTLDLRRLYESTERMWALLSIMHGCVEEPAIWLTVMDGLLARLAESICGHADPAHETITMCSAQEILAYATDGDLPQLPSTNPQTSPKSLKRDNFARNVFAELAGLYRGAVLLSFADASIPRSFPSRDSSQYKEWYEQLIPWHGQCGNSACFDRLKVDYPPNCKIQNRSLAVDVPDARVRKRKIWSIAIGVPDARIRKRKIRSVSPKEIPSPKLILAAHQSHWIVKWLTRACSTSSNTAASHQDSVPSSTTSRTRGIRSASPHMAKMDSWPILTLFLQTLVSGVVKGHNPPSSFPTPTELWDVHSFSSALLPSLILYNATGILQYLAEISDKKCTRDFC